VIGEIGRGLKMTQTTLTTQPMSEPTTAGPWWMRYRVVVTLVMMFFAVIACLDAWSDIARIVQKDDEASHILLVPLVFARIAWVRRDLLKDWQSSASLWGVLIALAGVGLWLYGNISAMQIVWHFGAILTLVGAFVSIQGLQIVRRLWPAFLVLLFLMPMPGTIRHPLALFLQNVSAQLTEVVTIAMGFDVVRNGNLLIINDYPVGIAEACNGMRMVSMLILVVFAFIFSENVRSWVRILLIALAVPLAIACNIIRLVPTVIAYGYFTPEVADQIHDWLGWVMVILSYFMLMGLLWLMRWSLLPVEPRPATERPRALQRNWFGMARSNRSPEPSTNSRASLVIAIAGVFLILGSAYGIGQSLPDGSEAQAYHAKVREVADELPREIGKWKAADIELPEAAVALLRPNVLISRRYTNEQSGQSFAFMIVQCADARDMEGHYPPNCYPTSGWTTLGQRPIQVDVGGMKAASMDYRFERVLQAGPETIEVVNLLVVPGNGFVSSMRNIRQLGGTVTDRYYGAAQIQFVFDGYWDDQERLEAVEKVNETLEPLIRVILDKPGD
jgi:exosortase